MFFVVKIFLLLALFIFWLIFAPLVAMVGTVVTILLYAATCFLEVRMLSNPNKHYYVRELDKDWREVSLVEWSHMKNSGADCEFKMTRDYESESGNFQAHSSRKSRFKLDA